MSRAVLRAAIPRRLRSKLGSAYKELQFLQRVFLARLSIQNDFVGYEKLIDYIDATRLYQLRGDFLEIGAFMGGGSAKLAKYGEKYHKKLIVIDVFDPGFDDTKNTRGEPLNVLYRRLLGHGDQRKIFDRNTKRQQNIVVHCKDSKQVTLPDTQLCFSFIDGNHDPEYVRSDFYLAWNATVSGGVVGFHDYGGDGGGDLPQVTQAINALIEENKATIADSYFMSQDAIMLLRKE
jgi:hypothetical protein